MPRYFIEVSYKGSAYSGFQAQDNANSIQAEVEKALKIFFRQELLLTGSSRTDAGVHALQNYFHFDSPVDLLPETYHLNAILPADIVVKSIRETGPEAHCRFDAVSREYRYYIYGQKDPFLQDRAYYFPFSIDMALMQQAAVALMEHSDFTSFSKRNTQVKTFVCHIMESEWKEEGGCLVYRVRGNRFLRGMVRGLVGTMLQVGRGKLSVDGFRDIIVTKDCTKADFSVPPHGLFLHTVEFPG